MFLSKVTQVSTSIPQWIGENGTVFLLNFFARFSNYIVKIICKDVT